MTALTFCPSNLGPPSNRASYPAVLCRFLLRSRNACLTRREKLFLLHPDREIYDSLPSSPNWAMTEIAIQPHLSCRR